MSSSTTPRCPTSMTLGPDYRFRLGKLNYKYRTLLPDTVFAQLMDFSPTYWPDTVEHALLSSRPTQKSQTGPTTIIITENNTRTISTTIS